MIGLLTDSNSQLPAELAEQYDIGVVPLTVSVGGTDYLEGEELDADGFYDLFDQRAPTVRTSQPSPGRFAEAYEAAARRGADEIISVHVGSKISGTVNSARLAATAASVPVHVVDTGTVSFGVACCVWEAAVALATGSTTEEAAALAAHVGPTVRNVFVVKALDLARAGGRLTGPGPSSGLGGTDPDDAPSAIHVLTLTDDRMEVVGQVTSVREAADAMAAHVRAAGDSLRAGIGFADRASAPLSDALHERLSEAPEVRDLVRYRVGPSVGAHTGPGTVGVMYYESP
ncbi:MAG TPA: DegV family protein [Acidimicrobiales bacterium]|nr:DegV family protein [Acidimicrobiales bacterium]